ncbi:MAG: DUF3696 domain-containing protein [Rhodobacteraceae bacterium]|nr:DUF3696 domain-containing protein [Paracoccaceae bacterium]
MQALVLLHQTMREHERSLRLMLNGAAISLGTGADVVDQVYGRREFQIALFDGDEDRFEWEFAGERDEMSMAVRRAVGETKNDGSWDIDNPHGLQCLVPSNVNNQSLTKRLCQLTYITAERLGPREYYAYDDPQLTPVVGSRGEYAASLLFSGRECHVLPELLVSGVPPTRFRQVEAHMAGFFPGIVLAIERVPRANAVTLGVRVSSDTDFHRPVHTGFGLTQVLPIVVAALSADKEDLLLIENPEVHLHPAGQAAMGEFLGKVASAGLQVLIETHSDHVLNGIRRAVRKGMLSCESVALHFFNQRSAEQNDSSPQVQSPAIDSYGNIDSWPKGFFDQFDNDMNDFAGWS